MIKVDLNVDLRKIPSLTFPELKEYYEALFNIPTTSTRKEYYVWRITNKLQEMRFGGLDNKTRRMLENMEIKELTFSLSENKSAKETLPLLSPDSYKLIGRINMREILPVPLCDISDKSAGTAEPVNTN